MAQRDAAFWSQAGSATAVAAHAGLSKQAAGAIRPDFTVPQQAEHFIAEELPGDAMLLAAAALGKFEVIWWALQCVRSVPELSSEQAEKALQAAESWVKNPTDELRRAAMAASEQVGNGTPAGCVALAVFLSEGSMGPPTIETIPPPEGLANFMAGNAAVLAAVLHEPEKATTRCQSFLSLAHAVAKGENHWNAAAAPNGRQQSPTPKGGRDFPPYPQPKR